MRPQPPLWLLKLWVHTWPVDLRRQRRSRSVSTLQILTFVSTATGTPRNTTSTALSEPTCLLYHPDGKVTGMVTSTQRGRPSSAPAILDAALQLLDDGETVSLDSVARAVGLTKPGLMYHFSTKAAMMDALVDHVVDRLETELRTHLPTEAAAPTAADRLRAYVQWSFHSPHRPSDLVVLTDPKLAARLRQRWITRLHPWVAIPDDTPPAARAALHAARLIADGTWLAAATNIFPLDDNDKPDVQYIALQLLEGTTT